MDKITLENKIAHIDKSLLDTSAKANNVSKILHLKQIARECNHLAAEIMENFSVNELLDIVERL